MTIEIKDIRFIKDGDNQTIVITFSDGWICKSCVNKPCGMDDAARSFKKISDDIMWRSVYLNEFEDEAN